MEYKNKQHIQQIEQPNSQTPSTYNQPNKEMERIKEATKQITVIKSS